MLQTRHTDVLPNTTKMPELPRITRSLRTFTNLGRIRSTVELEQNDLFRKQKEQVAKLQRYCFAIMLDNLYT